MDGGVPLSDDEVKGRNTWLLWTAGDQVLWDYLAQHGLGTADLLKTIDSRRRPSRFKDMGLVNQPGMAQAAQPDRVRVVARYRPAGRRRGRCRVRKADGRDGAAAVSQSQV